MVAVRHWPSGGSTEPVFQEDLIIADLKCPDKLADYSFVGCVEIKINKIKLYTKYLSPHGPCLHSNSAPNEAITGSTSLGVSDTGNPGADELPYAADILTPYRLDLMNFVFFFRKLP